MSGVSYSPLPDRSRLPPTLASCNERQGPARSSIKPQYEESRPTAWDGFLRKWSTRPDSNWRPSRWQRDALPTELLVLEIRSVQPPCASTPRDPGHSLVVSSAR